MGGRRERAGITKPARMFDLRSTLASTRSPARRHLFELAKLSGPGFALIERHYGTLIGGAHAGIAGRLDALEAALEQAAEDAADNV